MMGVRNARRRWRGTRGASRAAPFALALLLALGGPVRGDAEGGAPSVVDALVGDERSTRDIAAIDALVTLPPGAPLAGVELGRDAHTSHHAVKIAGAEEPHVHAGSDLFVALLSGRGDMRMGDEVRSLAPRSIVYIPRGTLHAFANTGDAPALAYVVYSPARKVVAAP